MGLPGRVEAPARALQRDARDRLAKTDPARGVSFLAEQVMALRPMAHRQHVVGELRGLAPDRRETGVTLDFALVQESFNPAHTVGISPHRIIDAGEVGTYFTAALFEKMWKQETHLEKGQRKLTRPCQLVPHLCRRRHH